MSHKSCFLIDLGQFSRISTRYGDRNADPTLLGQAPPDCPGSLWYPHSSLTEHPEMEISE